MLLADMWKELKSLRITVALNGDTNYRLDRDCRNLQKLVGEQQATIRNLRSEMSEMTRDLKAKDAEIVDKTRNLHAKDAQIEAMKSSTSWRVTGVIRFAGNTLIRLGLLKRCLMPVARRPRRIPSVARSLFAAWRTGGVTELKKALLHLPSLDALHLAWLDYQRMLNKNRQAIRNRIESLPGAPKISVLVPTYNTPERMLREMLQSVIEQLYQGWELCIADDGSSQAHVLKVLKEYAARDTRIKLHAGEQNRGVSHATNRALELATGEFAVLLDHDDLLERHALYRVAESILADRPDMLYSDEILVSGESQNVEQMVLRPVFSPEYLRSHPYIVHMVGFKTALLREIGGLDESLSISQDYDLILRAAEKSRTIVHIPEVLYRWRINHNSSTGQDKRKSVMDVSKSVLRRHLDRSSEEATVTDGPGFNFFDVRYPLQAGSKVAVVIPTKNHGDLVRQCIDSLRRTVERIAYDIVVVDHDSDDPETLAYLDGIAPEVTLLRYSGPFNFSKINNWAIAQLPPGYTHYLLCNNDIEAIRPGWLERMMELGQKPDVGIVGAMLYYPDGRTIQHAGVCVGAFGAAEHYAKRLRLTEAPQKLTASGRLAINHEMSAVTAACLLISEEAFHEVNGMDEEIAVGFGDVDLCLKVLEQGYRVLFCPHAELLHHESFTRGTSTGDPHPEDSERFKTKWADFLRNGDPYFNPGYTIYSTTWDINLPMHFRIDVQRRVYAKGEEGGRQRVGCSSDVALFPGAAG
jgi:GT2 family glycosyltransferase